MSRQSVGEAAVVRARLRDNYWVFEKLFLGEVKNVSLFTNLSNSFLIYHNFLLN